ncbi:hypothetical protein BKA80DRAFT_274849 [Phyllosticta citrichinensis]
MIARQTDWKHLAGIVLSQSLDLALKRGRAFLCPNKAPVHAIHSAQYVCPNRPLADLRATSSACGCFQGRSIVGRSGLRDLEFGKSAEYRGQQSYKEFPSQLSPHLAFSQSLGGGRRPGRDCERRWIGEPPCHCARNCADFRPLVQALNTIPLQYSSSRRVRARVVRRERS